MSNESFSELRASRDGLDSAFYILQTNAEEVRAFHLGITNDVQATLGFLQQFSGGRPNEVLNEPSRLLNNFLAAAITFRDFVKNHVSDHYAGTVLVEEYAHERDRLRNTGIVSLVYDLRNVALHASLPITAATIQLGGPLRPQFRMPKDRLLRLKRLTAPSRTFVESLDGDVALGALVDEYMVELQPFYGWLLRHEAELAEEMLIRRMTGGRETGSPG